MPRRLIFVLLALLVLAALVPVAPLASAQTQTHAYIGFDRNQYPGDASLSALRKHFDYTGYWLNNPPGARTNTWLGKRALLREQGFGFLVLANGRLDKEILAAHIKPDALGRKDAAAVTAAAAREGFPKNTLLFLDQEEGGRMLPEQRAYLLAWTEAIAAAGFRPGVYASGQEVNEGNGITITTAQDIRTQVTAQHLHPVALWVYEDACPPAPGCVLHTDKPLSASGTPDVIVWQYAQSPRRPEITAACAKTYAANGNCYANDLPGMILDLNLANSPDPSGGR
ncbi:MAG TPA: glycoside hydrolase domain-containing protein [Granulicella sp.]